MIANALPQSLIDNPLLSQWIAFEPQGRVRVGSGKVEIGQGILTALTQIAAEELDLAPEQVDLVSGQTDVSPAEGFTSGSYSIAVGGASIRLVCAEVRSLFLDRMADVLKCPVGELSVENGKFLRAGRDTGRDYWSIAGRDRRSNGAPPAPRRPSGRRATRSSASTCRVSTCRRRSPARASSTTSRQQNVLHARVLRQPWRGAHLAALDEAAVRKAAARRSRSCARASSSRSHRDNELAVMRAADAARTLARWDGGTPPRPTSARRHWLKAQPARSRTVDTGIGNARRRQPRGRGELFAAVRHLRFDRAVLRARRVRRTARLNGLVAQPGTGGAARLARARARPRCRSRHRVPPPGRRRLRPQHRRRRGVRRILHRAAPSGPHGARAMVARGRVRRRPDQHRHGDHAARGARRRQQARRLVDRNLEPAARPAAGHERQFQFHRRRGAAQRAGARTRSATCRTSAAAARPATRSRSTTCRATG